MLYRNVSSDCNGLGVVDTASTFTMFGEIVIMFLIQTGGLGLMTIAILIVWVLGKKSDYVIAY